LDYYQRYPDLVEQVTTEMVLETARRYWNLDCLAIVTPGLTCLMRHEHSGDQRC
jgi:hypothetical protein